MDGEWAKTHCTVCGKLQPEDAPGTLQKDTVVYYCYGFHGRLCKPPSPCATYVKCLEPRCPDGRWVCDKPECSESLLQESGWKCHLCQKVYQCGHPLTGIQWQLCTAPVPERGDGGCCYRRVCQDCVFKYKKYDFYRCKDHEYQLKEMVNHTDCKTGKFRCMDEDCPYW